MNMRRLVLVGSLALAAVGACKKEVKDTATTPPAGSSAALPGPVGKDGVRRIEITANAEGYTPARIVGKPGEKLALVFTRTIEAECISKLKTPSGELVDLPLNKPIEVAVTVPQSGELGFACGMDMFHGVIVSQPAT
jgi:plastocyanin domain-containing protein